MSKYEVDFCERPTWWPFINAFRYAINRPDALYNIEDWLLVNLSIIDHKATYLNQMIEEGSRAIDFYCFTLRNKRGLALPADVISKIKFVKRCLKTAEENNITLSSFTKSCLENAKYAASISGISWKREIEVKEE